ncbi:MAG: efflux RND transporter periplasmic adaptor subunit [Leptolyngbyaceae cyanobacterium SL_7_1]|nr:efflux RND transporter periplasmic adaptor subunit [Leptolyngbyaceae cyanobacterium SL_7_1]
MLDQPKRGKLPSGWRWLAGSGALAVLSLAGWAAYAWRLDRPAEAVAVRLITVEWGTVETSINESGTVELAGQQTLVSPAEGAVEQLLVQPGDRVQAGQVLLTLRNPERQTALLEQQVKITQQQLTLARSQQQISEAQAQLGIAQERLKALQGGAVEGAIAQSTVQDQAIQVSQFQTALRDAQTAARTATLELQTLELERQRTQQQLEDTVVTAPIDGMILGVSVNDGDGVELRTELLTLGNPVQELVKLQLSTLNANRVRLNQLARVSVIGPEAEIYSGRVQSLYPQAVRSNDDQSSDAAQATVPTTIRLDTPTRTLIPGSQVNVEIVLEQRQDVPTLAIEAIQRTGSEPFVWVVDEAETVQRQPVTLGLEGLTTVEITDGVRVGDRVALPPVEGTLEPNTPVLVESSTANSD